MSIKSILSTAKQRLLYLVGRTPEQIWKRQLDRLMQEVDPDIEKATRTLIDNFHSSALFKHGYSMSPGHDEMNNSLITIQLSALKKMRCINLIGFQPMNGPVSKVLSLQYAPDELNTTVMLLTAEEGIVEAKSHKLQLQLPMEAMVDSVVREGLDIRPEIEAAVANELALELDEAVVNKIKGMSKKLDAEEITDWRMLSFKLQHMCTNIAISSRRGRGNWAILPLGMITMMMENPNYLHYPEDSNNAGLRLMGELLLTPESESGIKIYSDILQTDNTIVVGYKGQSEIDTGYVYSPYIMTVPVGIMVHKETFESTQGFITRYGDKEFNSENYYSSMEVLV